MGSKLSPLEDSLVRTPPQATSSMESFRSTIECTPEPHAVRPRTAHQRLDHAIGVIWHCFDAFRQRIYTVSPESIDWAINFLLSSTVGATDELHFIVSYLRCVQALVQLVCRQARSIEDDSAVTEQFGASLQRSVTERVTEDLSTARPEKQQLPDQEPTPELIDELMRLYAVLAIYKAQLQTHHQSAIEFAQLQGLEAHLLELNESFDSTVASSEQVQLALGTNI